MPRTMSLKPGILVALRTSINGGCEYQRIDLETNRPLESGAEVARWETTRVVPDVEEYERALKVRSKASSLIRGTCSKSDFGLLCTGAREEQLDAAYAEALALIAAHNANAKLTQITLSMLKGRIEASDELAAKAIGREVRDLLDAMKAGLAAADVNAIRDAASKARQLGTMLDDTTADKVSRAIEEARSAARAIVKRIETGGEDAAMVLQELSRKHLDEARFAFLDLDTPGEGEGGSGSGAPPARQLDLDIAAEAEGSDNDEKKGAASSPTYFICPEV